MEFWQQYHNAAEESFSCHVASAGHADSISFNTDCARYRHDYQIIYLHKGTGKVRIRGTWHPLHSGTLLFYYPMEYQEYSFPQEKDRELYWLYFDNIPEREMLDRFRIPDNVMFEVLEPAIIRQIFRKITEEITGHYQGQALMLSLYTGQLLLLISRHTMKHSLSEKTDIGNILDAVQDIKRDIEFNYMSFVKVHEYAARCGISTTKFINLFRQNTGMTPIAYRQMVRLKNAERLLCTSDKSIQDIATSVGFHDGLYFSKVFQKQKGISPSAYRKEILNSKKAEKHQG